MSFWSHKLTTPAPSSADIWPIWLQAAERHEDEGEECISCDHPASVQGPQMRLQRGGDASHRMNSGTVCIAAPISGRGRANLRSHRRDEWCCPHVHQTKHCSITIIMVLMMLLMLGFRQKARLAGGTCHHCLGRCDAQYWMLGDMKACLVLHRSAMLCDRTRMVHDLRSKALQRCQLRDDHGTDKFHFCSCAAPLHIFGPVS